MPDYQLNVSFSGDKPLDGLLMCRETHVELVDLKTVNKYVVSCCIQTFLTPKVSECSHAQTDRQRDRHTHTSRIRSPSLNLPVASAAPPLEIWAMEEEKRKLVLTIQKILKNILQK